MGLDSTQIHPRISSRRRDVLSASATPDAAACFVTRDSHVTRQGGAGSRAAFGRGNRSKHSPRRRPALWALWDRGVEAWGPAALSAVGPTAARVQEQAPILSGFNRGCQIIDHRLGVGRPQSCHYRALIVGLIAAGRWVVGFPSIDACVPPLNSCTPPLDTTTDNTTGCRRSRSYQ